MSTPLLEKNPISETALFFCTQNLAGEREEGVLEGESEVRKFLALKVGEESQTTLISREREMPRGWEAWDGVFFLGSGLANMGAEFEEEPFGTLIHQGRPVKLSRLRSHIRDLAGMIGRLEVMASLRDAVQAERAEIQHVVAAPGLGKTTLLEHFLQQCALPAEQVFRISFARGTSGFLERWQDLARLGEGEMGAPDEGVVDRLSSMIAEKIGKAGFAMVLLDDCHWMSMNDISMLRRLLSRLENQLFVVLFSRPLKEDSPLLQLARVEHVLEPLTEGELLELVKYEWPDLSDPELAATQLLQVAGGHPLLTVEILKSPSFEQTMPELTQKVQALPRAIELARVCEGNPALSNPQDREVLGLLAHLRGAFTPALANEVQKKLHPLGKWQSGLQAGLLKREGDERIVFRHALLQAACQEWFQGDSVPHRQVGQLLREHENHIGAAYQFHQIDEEVEASRSHFDAATEAFKIGDLGTAAQQTLQAVKGEQRPAEIGFDHYWRGGQALYAFGRHHEASLVLQEGIQQHYLLRYQPSKRVAVVGYFASLFPKREQDFSDEELDVYVRGIQSLRIIAEAAWYGHDLWGCVCAIAKATALAGKLPDSAGVAKARIFPSSAMVYGGLLPQRSAKKLLLRSFQYARSLQPQMSYEVALVTGSYYFGLKRWRKARFLLRASRLGSQRSGNEIFALRASCLEAMDYFFRGELEQCIAFTDEMAVLARSLDSVHLEGLLKLIRGVALADLKSPQLCLRIFLTMDASVYELHSFEAMGLQGAIGYLTEHHRNESLKILEQGLLEAEKRAHTIYSSTFVFSWMIDAYLVAVTRGEVDQKSLLRLRKCIRKHSLFFPSARPAARLLLAVIRLFLAGKKVEPALIAKPLEKAREAKLDYIVRWGEGHLEACGFKGYVVQEGVKRRFSAVYKELS